MRKLSIALTLFLVIGLSAAPAQAQSFMNEPGSILVFPLIDNINGVTIVSISNLAAIPVTLGCLMVTHPVGDPTDFEPKNNFEIELTEKEAFVWNTAGGHAPNIQPFDGEKGFLFCFATDGAGLEIAHNFLIGDAKVINLPGAYAWGYNAIPHQELNVVGDRVLNLDGVEYSEATSQIMFSGLAALPPGLDGVFVAANIEMNLMTGEQPPLTLNFDCYNEEENPFSLHAVPHQTFVQYPLASSLGITTADIFSLGFHCTVTANSTTGAGPKPIWAVFGQNLVLFGWGSNVWQEPGTNAPAIITLP
jgi:hypothetical protein